jgi:hypothetical protein
MALAIFFEPFQIGLVVLGGEKNGAAAVAALDDVVWNVCKYGACESWHRVQYMRQF